jgi:predicted exporter
LALLLFFAIGYYLNGADSDGVYQMAVFMMECIVASCIVVYLFLSKLNRIKNQHPLYLETAIINRPASEGVQSE